MLITTDLHLTDSAKDEYRWSIFPWLKETIRSTSSTSLFILGDLTDAKDGHKSRLVNRIIDSLLSLEVPVYILQGNHDYVEGSQAFFSFLSKPICENIKWFGGVPSKYRSILMLPHTRTPSEDWSNLDFQDYNMVFCHQTFNGANAGNHILNANVGPKFFREHGLPAESLVLSGDIHMPQSLPEKNPCLHYVGCPYPVAFGDSFSPRVIKINQDLTIRSIPVPSIRRWSLDIESVEDLEPVGIKPGDQAKLRIHLDRSEFPFWEQHKSYIQTWATKNGVELFSLELRDKPRKRDEAITAAGNSTLDNKTLLARFSEHEDLDPEILEVGLSCLESVTTEDG